MAERKSTIEELRDTVRTLENVKPDSRGRYTFNGKTYTKTAWNEYIKPFKDRLDRLEGEKYIRGEEQSAETRRLIEKEIQAANRKRTELNEYLTDFVQAFNKARTLEEEDRLGKWKDYYQSEVNKLNKYVDDLQAGRVAVGAVDVDAAFQKYQPEDVVGRPGSTPRPSAEQPSAVTPDISNIKSKDQARQEISRLRERSNNLKGLIGERSGGTVLYYEAPGMVGMSKGQRDAIINNIEARITALNFKFFAETPAATTEPNIPSAPFTPAPGQGVFGETLPTTTVGGVPTGVTPSPVAAPETPVDETPDTTPPSEATTTPGATTRPVTPSPTTPAPSYTDPGTGVTYQPGEQVGGEDRTLPNGGAVVDGVYIPPGIDYTWLGQQVPEDWEAAAKELYGAYYEMVKQYPELGTLIKNSIQQGWSDDKFQYELEQTNWWKTTSANSREWETQLIQDPATAQQRLDNRTALLRDTAQRLGITLTSESLAKIAEDSIRLGLELTSQLENIVGAEALRSSGTVSQLRYGYVGNSIRESARKYGVALSDTTFNEWVNKIAVGAESTETFESYANQIARNLYPSLNDGFDRGLSFAQMTDPYAQTASRILEIPSTQVDFTDPKWAQAFTMRDDKGQPSQMSFGEWADYLRTDPRFGWEYTDDAKNRAFTVANRLAELFGAA